MKLYNFKLFFCGFLFMPLVAFAQWTDSFSDGNFSKDPVWIGESSAFVVNHELQLQLNAPAITGQSYLVTESKRALDVVWGFSIRMDFNPSSGNYVKVYLMSDKSDLGASLNGYFLRIGGADDDISLFRQDGLISTLLVDGPDGMLDASENKLSFQVLRTSQGVWKISCDSTGNTDFTSLGSFSDNTYSASSYFGIQCIYTSTRSDKFYFDNFGVTAGILADMLPPHVKEIKPLSNSLIQIEFSEDIEAVSLNDVSHFRLPSGNTIQKIQIKNARTLALSLDRLLSCKEKEEIEVTGIADLAGNKLSDTTLWVSYCSGSLYDVLITEIMADPDPPVYLPKVEYLELFNHSGGDVNLASWILQVDDNQITLPGICLRADSFLLICSSKGCDNFREGNCVEALAYGCLNNTGTYIGLKNKSGELIHWVNYDESFYKEDLKSGGGWALEMIDIDNACAGNENWTSSKDNKGGSPGKVNSVKGSITDSDVFRYEHIFLSDDTTVRLYFSKPLDVESLSTQMFSINNLNPLRLIIDSMQHQYIDLRYTDIFKANTLYELSFTNDVMDCSGHKIINVPSITFMKSSEVAVKDILINEVLFDALPEGEEFIEFYNNSNKFINSSDLRFSYRNVSSEYESSLELGSYPFLIPPKAYIVSVKRGDKLEKLHPIPDVGSMAVNKNFPVLNNAEGCIKLMNRSLEIIDEFCYSEKMHFGLLVNKNGVSLERVNSGNWHSASSTSGYATPGAVNSQWFDEAQTEDEIALEYEIFSPNNDGYRDVETISYRMDQAGVVANITVFDAWGKRIKIICDNHLLGSSGSVIWDGIDENGRMAATGIYLFYIELRYPSGKTREYRKNCVVAGDIKG